jgi:hypothetical protein
MPLRSQHFRDHAAILVSVGGSLIVIGGVFTSIGAASATASATASGQPLDLVGNPWFDVGIGAIVLGFCVVILGALYLTPRFAGPRLRIVFDGGPEFITVIPATVGMVNEAERGSGSGVASHDAWSIRIRIEETHGVEAKHAHVRVTSLDPPHPDIRTPALLPWERIDGDQYCDVPANGHAYAVLATAVPLEDDRSYFFGPGLIIENQIEVGIEGWWGSRKLANFHHAFANPGNP